jgi:hypothetical protein
MRKAKRTHLSRSWLTSCHAGCHVRRDGMTATRQTYATDLRDNSTTYATTLRDKVLGENIAVFIKSKNMRFDEWYPPYMKRSIVQRECECIMYLKN